MTKHFKIASDNTEPFNKFSIEGCITHENCLNAKEEIHKCLFTNRELFDCVTIDCAKLEEIDGSGVGVLVNLYIALQCQGNKLFLINLQEQPRKLLIYLDIKHFFMETKQCHFPSALQNA